MGEAKNRIYQRKASEYLESLGVNTTNPSAQVVSTGAAASASSEPIAPEGKLPRGRSDYPRRPGR